MVETEELKKQQFLNTKIVGFREEISAQNYVVRQDCGLNM
jgi:hypothetical protein